MPAEPRAPVGIMLMQEEGGCRLQGYPATTEEPSDLPEVFKIYKAGLPVKVFLLRQKLYRKSKQETNCTWPCQRLRKTDTEKAGCGKSACPV